MITDSNIDLEYDLPTVQAAEVLSFIPSLNIQTISDAERREAWLADRRTCLTGTEVPAILGLSHWLKPIDVWMEKKGLRPDFEPNEAMIAGKRFEHAILEETASRLGRPLIFADPYQLCRVPDFPLLGATLDATWQDTGCPVDAKNIRYKDEEWGEDGTGDFPIYYRLQLHIQMMAKQKQEADLAVCFTGQDFYRYTIGRDAEIDALVKEEAEAWWKKHILGDVAPEPDGSESFGVYLKAKFRRNTDVMIEASDESRTLMEQLKAARDLIKINESDASLFEQQLKSIIGDAAGIKGLCTWRNNKDGVTTDWKSIVEELRSEVPADFLKGIISIYTTPKPGARVFRLSK